MWFLLIVSLYLGIVVLMCLLENRFVYPSSTAEDEWEGPPDPDIVEVTFASSDGNTIHAWYLAQPGSSEAILICHGNAGNLSHRGRSLLRFRESLNRSILIFDYPGYGKSTGKPSEAGCYASADAALGWLNASVGIPCERVILYGDSLGGGVALETARRHPCRALILTKTFTSLPGVAGRLYWWLPTKWMMSNRFDNLSKIKDLHLPILIASATDDRLVPFEMGKQLYDAAAEPREFLPLEGEGHNDRLTDSYLAALRHFLDQHSLPRPPR